MAPEIFLARNGRTERFHLRLSREREVTRCRTNRTCRAHKSNQSRNRRTVRELVLQLYAEDTGGARGLFSAVGGWVTVGVESPEFFRRISNHEASATLTPDMTLMNLEATFLHQSSQSYPLLKLIFESTIA